jgi:CheY-like chemotaxis protein
MPNEEIHILLVEDNDDHAELVARQLSEQKMPNRLTRLSDGQEALDYLFHNGKFASEHTSRPSIILVDLRLPKVDGIEVIRQIKADKELRNIPTVVLTTSDAERDIAKAYENHANSYIVKPVDFQKFRDLMQDLGAYWFTWNKHPKNEKSPE